MSTHSTCFEDEASSVPTVATAMCIDAARHSLNAAGSSCDIALRSTRPLTSRAAVSASVSPGPPFPPMRPYFCAVTP
eukprot:scaffold29745_cov76-Phaeocystis_antarctica.AAC.5